MTSTVLVTGASGFVGSTLCEMLTAAGYRVRAGVRRATPRSLVAAEQVVIGDIDANTDWAGALRGADCVIHLAALAHVPDSAGISSEIYFEVNERGTRRLASQCGSSGVRRLLYLSSVKVNGEGGAHAYTAEDEPRPEDAYGRSKWLGEQHVQSIATAKHFEAVIVRPPLVYGPGVRANFLRLLRWVHKGLPLPLGSISNRRSLVSIWNLCDLLIRLIDEPRCVGGTWMVSDGEDLSTPELIRRMGRAMGRPARLIAVPGPLLQFVATLIGRTDDFARLSGDLCLDVTQTKEALGWSPPLSVDEGLARTVQWYIDEGRTYGR